MPAYSTLSEAVNDLQRRGYTDDLALGGHCLVCDARGINLDPHEFEIDEFHRFEGNSEIRKSPFVTGRRALPKTNV